jgi:TLD
VDVYPYTGANNYIQFCTQDRIAVGGGSPSSEDDAPTKSVLSSHKHHEWGFGLSLSSDLLTGTSSPCITFGSPSLSTVHKDGSVFEIINMELWTVRFPT